MYDCVNKCGFLLLKKNLYRMILIMKKIWLEGRIFIDFDIRIDYKMIKVWMVFIIKNIRYLCNNYDCFFINIVLDFLYYRGLFYKLYIFNVIYGSMSLVCW